MDGFSSVYTVPCIRVCTLYQPVKVTGIPFDIENPPDLAGSGLGGPHQALYDQANFSRDTFFADFEKVEMESAAGLVGFPSLFRSVVAVATTSTSLQEGSNLTWKSIPDRVLPDAR
eukprot:SAG22_NODE_1906_length_3335_cov_1.833127_3_plen_116_part_00